MKLFYLLLFTIYLLICVGCRFAASPISVSNQPISINNVPQTNLPLPSSNDIEKLGWKTSGGEEKKLSDYRGKVVVLDFWATYCPPCLEEIPHLNELQTKYGAENLQIVGLHAGDEEDRVRVPAFAERLKINYLLATPEAELTRFIFASEDTIPQTAVFDRNGKLIGKFVGFDLKIKNDLDKAVEEALKR